jgi:carboxyl-terminal processing protease
MTKPWRNAAIVLFAAALLAGGFAGDRLLAVSGETQGQMRLYTELLHLAHEGYGAEVSYRDLIYASIDGMLRTLDPHTNFLSPESYESMKERQQGSFYGLGILVSMRNGQLTVISPIEGTPGWRLGLRAGDVISTIEGEPTDTMSLDEAVSKLKGPKDTQVNVTIVRRGLDEPLQLAITRDEIPQNTVRYAYMMEPGTGYIRLTDFSRSTAPEMEEALAKLRQQGLERLVLDLRSNGGGLLDQTVAVSNFFVPERTKIVETRGRLPSSYQSYQSDGEHPPIDVPLVVLVNNGTASAAEILAGAIQDHDVGLVVGTPTWGKGLVQTVYNLSYGAGIALTTAKYYTPSGRLIQRDYSSYFDYYTHFENAREPEVATPPDVTPEVEQDEPGYATDLGRTVYGGGGIAPDVFVDLPDGPPALQFLYAHNTFFDFAVDYQRRRASWIRDRGWEPPPTLLDEFRDWLVKEEVASREDVDEMFEDGELAEFVRRQIHSDIFTAAFGTEAAHRVLARGDVQIQAALELFDDAATLLSERHGELTRRAERLAAREDEKKLEGREIRPE